MLDVVIRGGTIVDGSGGPSRLADLGIRDGRIVKVGSVVEDARATIDATGKIVSPGFVDIHTYYDAQAFWDGTLSPSPYHGVTSVVGGNCGFSIAPLSPEAGLMTVALDPDRSQAHTDHRDTAIADTYALGLRASVDTLAASVGEIG